MYKKLLIIVLLLIGITGCNNKNNEPEYYVGDTVWVVYEAEEKHKLSEGTLYGFKHEENKLYFEIKLKGSLFKDYYEESEVFKTYAEAYERINNITSEETLTGGEVNG